MKKKFKLKPGIHQFAPGSHAVHHNGNLSDDEAEWYLAKYPHIAALFEDGVKKEIPIANKPEALETEKASAADISGHFIIQ
ncbi:hypothetical protein HDF24_24065 [Mucilaginibacter sp. X4EP1]|uniref:hypothetical protein n=1 Tax=Mucilaginibacter sp. X4EP1 TaxID=2723092 RepID=UPI00216A25B2|nr:hypothetical protein [Mucilaginibacter sp. X4EP1]MCS3816170.1 hypothetical protein [Mucilaginibacter sp. X4EP1]